MCKVLIQRCVTGNANSALHLAYMLFRTKTYLLWESFSHSAITVRIIFINLYQAVSIAQASKRPQYVSNRRSLEQESDDPTTEPLRLIYFTADMLQKTINKNKEMLIYKHISYNADDACTLNSVLSSTHLLHNIRGSVHVHSQVDDRIQLVFTKVVILQTMDCVSKLQ